MNSQNKKANLLKFALLSSMFVWSLLAYIELGKYMQQGILFARIIDKRPYVSDFANFYNAGLLARESLNKKQNIYDIELQDRSLRKIIAPVVPEQPFYFQYPPYLFVLCLPLAFLSINGAWIAWTTVAAILIVSTLSSLFTAFQSRSRDESSSRAFRNKKRLTLAFILSSYPAWLSFELGQTSLYLLAALSFMILKLKEQKNYQAGMSGLLLMVKLQYTPLVFLAGSLFGKAAFLLSWFASCLLLLLLSFSILGMENLQAYPAALFSGETGSNLSGVSSYMMQNLRGQLCLILGDPSLIRTIVIIAFAFACISVVLLNQILKSSLSKAVSQENHASRLALTASYTVIISLLVSPHTHAQDYLLLALPYILLPERSLPLTRKMLLLLVPLSWLFFFLQAIFLLAKIQPFFLYLSALLVVMLIETRTLLSASKQGLEQANEQLG